MILVAIHTLKLEPYDYRPDIYFFVSWDCLYYTFLGKKNKYFKLQINKFLSVDDGRINRDSE